MRHAYAAQSGRETTGLKVLHARAADVKVAKSHQTVLALLPPLPLARASSSSSSSAATASTLLQGSSAAPKLDPGSHNWPWGSVAPSRWSPHTTVLMRLIGLDLELPTVPLLLPPPPPLPPGPPPPGPPPCASDWGGWGERGVRGVRGVRGA